MEDVYPRVTVGLSTRNRLPFLKQTLETIRNQSYKNTQIRICCHKCTDGTIEYLSSKSKQDPRISFFKYEEEIFYPGWNKALVEGGDEYCAIASDDDIYLPDWLSKMVSALVSAPNAGFAYCRDSCIDVYGNPISRGSMPFPGHTRLAKDSFHAELIHHYVRGPGVVTRTKIFKKAGMFYPDYIYGDPLLFVGMTKFARAVYVPEILIWYRLHQGSMTAAKNTDIFRNTSLLMKTFNVAVKQYGLDSSESLDFLTSLWRGFFAPVCSADPASLKAVIRMHKDQWERVRDARIKLMLVIGANWPRLMILLVKILKRYVASSARLLAAESIQKPIVW